MNRNGEVDDGTKDLLPDGTNQQTRRTVSSTAMRRKRQNHTIRDRVCRWNVDVAIPCHVVSSLSSNRVLAVLTQALWKHLYYARGLSPIPSHQVLSLVGPFTVESISPTSKLIQSQDPPLTPTAKTAKRQNSMVPQRTMDAAQKLHNDIVLLLLSAHLEIRHVLISLGTSWSRPKELYQLDAGAVALGGKNDEHTDENAIAQQERCSVHYQSALAGKFLRKVVEAESQAESELSTGSSNMLSPADQLFVTVGVSASTFSQAFEDVSCPISHDTVIIRRDLPLDAIRSYKQLRRSASCHLSISGVDSSSANNDTKPLPVPGPNQPNLENQDLVWMTIKTRLKGFSIR